MVSRPLNTQGDMGTATKILGMNISGQKTIAVYGDLNGLIYERAQMEGLSGQSFPEAFDSLCDHADKLLKVCRAQGLSSPEVISLAVSGPVDLNRGIVMAPPDLPKWDEAPLKGRLSVRYNLPVFIEQRSNASALAEMYFGAGASVQDQIFLDLEPVVAAGIIKNGRIYHGANDAAGEIGFMRMMSTGPAGLGSPGSLTGFASGLGMAELAHLRFPAIWSTPPLPYAFVRAVNDGQDEARQVLAETADHLGKALLWLIFTLDPELVIFGHPADLLGENFLSPLRDAVLRHGGADARLLPRLALSKLAAKLDDIAALAAVIDAYKKRTRE
ncbi:MAG: ROK family protein [Chloroflexi bacterium]|nr:ROK family protein [Chloroflexota bacterium]